MPVRPHTRGSSTLPHLAAIASSALLALVVTYPLVTRLGTHLAGGGDYHDAVCFAWNNWWIRHAIVDLHQRPYLTEHLLVPFPVDLRLHTLGLLYGLLSMPVEPLFGPIALVNLQILATPALNGYAIFLLARKWFGRDDVALLCGAAASVCPGAIFHLHAGRPSCAALWTVALSLLFLRRLVEAPRRRNALCLAAALIALLSADQQLPIFASVVLGLYLASVARARRALLLDRRLWGYALLVLLLIAYPLWLLFVRPFLQTPGYSIPHPSEALNYSVPLGMLANPKSLWMMYGTMLPLGALAALAMVRRTRGAAFGLVVAGVCMSLTLGPVLGETHVPLPFAALRLLPGINQFRAPYRFSMPAALGMALALGAVLTTLFTRVEQRNAASGKRVARYLAAGLALLVLADAAGWRAANGFGTRPVPDEPIYRRIAATPGDFTVLEIPFGVRSGTDLIGRGYDVMLYQPIHGKRLVNGYLSRVPLIAMDYFRRSPALMFLGNETVPPGDLASDFDAKLRELDVRVIVIHPEMMDADRLAAVTALLRARRDLAPVPTGTAAIAYDVAPRP